MTKEALTATLIKAIVIGLHTEAKQPKLRSDLTDEQKIEAIRTGRIQFVSAGATRKR